MKLFELFNCTQEELYERVKDKIVCKTSAVWLTEGVKDVGILPKSDMIFVFFEGSLMCVSERFLKSKDKRLVRKVKATLIKCANLFQDGKRSLFTEDKDYFELVAFKKGWFEWLDS